MWTFCCQVCMSAMHAHFALQIGVKMCFHKADANFHAFQQYCQMARNGLHMTVISDAYQPSNH
jgi:hypothetical protein